MTEVKNGISKNEIEKGGAAESLQYFRSCILNNFILGEEINRLLLQLHNMQELDYLIDSLRTSDITVLVKQRELIKRIDLVLNLVGIIQKKL
jgi:hypothetical protein